MSHADPKPELRARLRRLRAELPFAERDRRARALVAVFQTAIKLDRDDVVGAYANHGAEMSLWPLLQALHAQGVKLALPVAVAPDKPLIFRAWKPGDALVRGAHGNAEPAPSLKIAKPTVLLVPLLGFDAACFRLGQGGGYYDRTLALLRKSGGTRAIGIGYSIQQVDSLPFEAHDQQLDAVLTELGLLEAPVKPVPVVQVKAKKSGKPAARPAKPITRVKSTVKPAAKSRAKTAAKVAAQPRAVTKPKKSVRKA